MSRLFVLGVLLAALSSNPASAQQTRAEQLAQERAAKALALSTYQPNRIERTLLSLDQKRVIERLSQRRRTSRSPRHT